MNIVHSGSRYQIYGNSIETSEKLAPITYTVNFNQFTGFFLEEHPSLTVKEDKIYGNTMDRVNKILKSFQIADRNFGVILSGPKGTGKSLLARMLSQCATGDGYPVLIIKEYIPGLADFISSIDQEVMVLLDEFEKTFAPREGVNPQEEMLPLLDGLDGGKKLFVVSCNEVDRLNEYLVNRPGRFHYNFIVGAPNSDEIAEYLTDKLLPQYHFIIPQVVMFSVGADMSYDILRAIVFELNQGYDFKEALADLNISKETQPRFTIYVTFEDGEVVREFGNRIDLFEPEREFGTWMSIIKGTDTYGVRIEFRVGDVVIDPRSQKAFVPNDKATIRYDESDFNESEQELLKYYKNRKVARVELERENYLYRNKYTV